MQGNAQFDALRLKQHAQGYSTQQMTTHCKAYTLVFREKTQKEFDIHDCTDLVATNDAQCKRASKMGGSFNHDRIQTLRQETEDTKEKMEQYMEEKTTLLATLGELDHEARPVAALLGDLCDDDALRRRAVQRSPRPGCDDALHSVLDMHDSLLTEELLTCVKKLPPIQPKAELEEKYTEYMRWLHFGAEAEEEAAARQREANRQAFMQNMGLLWLDNGAQEAVPELVVPEEPAVLKSSPNERFCAVGYASRVDAELLAAGQQCLPEPVPEDVPPPTKNRTSMLEVLPLRSGGGSGGSGGGGWGGSAGALLASAKEMAMGTASSA